MSAWQAIQKLQLLLGEIPSDTLPVGHCSTARPSATSDLPAVVVSAEDVDEISAGLGGLVATRRLPGPGWESSTATRCSGVLAVELWTATAAAMVELADATFQALRSTPAGLAQTGFTSLTVRSIGPSEQAPLGETGALRMAVRCSFSHETVTTGAADTEGLIRTVHVELIDELHEGMEIP